VNGNRWTVKALIVEGADVNAKAENGTTALMNAAVNGHRGTVKNAAEWGHTGTVKALIVGGADVNAKAENGTTALMNAVVNGHTGIVKLLKKAGARE
jgi:ankyrin repeat protein